MKQLASQKIWCHNIDRDIEILASSCEVCKIHNQSPHRSYESCPKSSKTWDRVRIVFAGPFLILCGSFVSMHIITTEDTILVSTTIFSIEGIPNTIVSDNGTHLTSKNLEKFCSKLGIQHITITIN